MPTARKQKSGNWRCQAFDHVAIIDGKKKYVHKSFTARTKHEAERLAVEFLQNKNRPSSDLILDEAINRYIDMKQNVLSPSTLRGYRSIQRNAYGDMIRMRIDQITSEAAQSVFNALAVDHSSKSCRNALGLLTAVISTFLPGTVLRVTLPQRKALDYYTPSDDDIKKLLDAIKYPELYKAVLLAAFGTLRRSEICGLQYDDISGDSIRVHRGMVESESGWILKDFPKNDTSNRRILYPHFVIEALGTGTGQVVKMTPKRIDVGFARARNRAGLPYFRFHDLRAYSVSIAHALSIPDAYLMQRGGWSSPDTYRNVYRRVIGDEDEKITARLNAHFEKLHS
jgi:integrase